MNAGAMTIFNEHIIFQRVNGRPGRFMLLNIFLKFQCNGRIQIELFACLILHKIVTKYIHLAQKNKLTHSALI